MSETLAYARGDLCRPAAPLLLREADALATREGIFETLHVAAGVVREADLHLDRLLAAARLLGVQLRESRAQLLEATRAVASTASAPSARLRITAFEDGSEVEVMVTIGPYDPPSRSTCEGGVQATLARDAGVRRADPSRQVKSLAWRRRGEELLRAAPASYDVLVFNDAGRVAEGARSNVVARRGGLPTTPPLSEGCLPGTVRARLLESGAVREGVLDTADLLGGAEVVLTNSLVGVISVAQIDDSRCEVTDLAAELRAVWETLRS